MKLSRTIGGPCGRWVAVLLAGLCFAWAPGCANQRLLDLHRGTSCSAENVRKYAAGHNLSYEQALAELRKEDKQLWSEEETRQATLRQQATPATEKSSPPDESPEQSRPKNFAD